jgi:hypothetical protein
MKVRACLRSGACCKKAPCGFGQWNENQSQCAFLGKDETEQYTCLKYAEISQDPSSIISPAFGAGCCMPLGNTERDKIRADKYQGKEQIIEIQGDW